MFLILFSTTILSFFFYHLYWKRRTLPPGPMPIPLIGNLLSMGRPQPGYECFRRWTKEYGDVFTFWMGSEPYIVISSYNRIKETFIKDADTYADKKPQNFQREFRGGDYGVIETNGPFWRDHRRFALHQLRDFGLGKDLMQERILIEVKEMFKKFDRDQNLPKDVPKTFNLAVANVINQVLFGYRFEGEKEREFERMEKLLHFQESAFKKLRVIVEVFVPLARYLPGTTVKELLNHFKTEFYEFFDARIAEHRAKVDFDSENSEDFAEAYLKEQKRRGADGDFETFNDKQFANMCLDIWFAGLVTTLTTMTWTISYLLNYPEYLEKLHEELDRVIGSDRLITTADRNDLPYMNAVINESQRCANIVPINVFHQTTKDTVIADFPIPKGTGVLAQISTVMLDETVFPDPYKFHPDRFIENGKLKKIEEHIPFSIGKRQCLGEGLARMELFLFLANFFNRYNLECVEGKEPCIDKEKDFGVTPRKFEARLKRRYQ